MELIFVVILAVAIVVPSQCENIPVLIWGSESNNIHLPSVSSLNTVSLYEFKEDYVKPLMEDSSPLVVFLQDALSLEDFSLYGNAYGSKGKSSFENLQKAIPDDKPSLFLQSVESPAKALESLSSSAKTLTLEDGQYSIAGKEGYTVVLVKLPETAHSQDRKERLSKNDEIIGGVLDEVAAKSPQYRALFTGSQPSWLSFESKEKNRVARHLLQNGDTADNGTVSVVSYETCFLMVTKGISYAVVTGNNTDVPTPTSLGKPTASGVCGSQITLDFSDLKNFTSMQIGFGFVEYARNWYIVNVTVSYTDKGTLRTGTVIPSDVWAPMNWSYSCGSQTIRVPIDNKEFDFYLMLDDWQIQQGDGIQVFGQSYDCVGFFTIPIWMGIIVIAIMLIILFTAIFALTTIKTMDRFDDPKGKGLTITTSD